MATKSMTDIAYDILSSKKRSIAFNKLWEDVLKQYKCANDQIGLFYNDLSLDSRFVNLKDGKWDLKERRKFSETFVDISKFEDTEEEQEENTEEETEDSPYTQEDEY